ncbi:MAG TPA: ABC transporter permease [Burkholderiales bacterium]|nr:ABC transporter permease [Burkholderiales bacterium]
MSLGALLRLALRALAINKLRSALTMLGIVIGVGAVIVMMGVGAGAQARVEEQIRALGSNLLLIMSGARTQSGARLALGSGQSLSEDDAIAINREIPEATAAPALRGGAQVIWGNANWATQIYGTTPEYLEVREWRLAAGRSFYPSEVSGAGKVVLIGSTVARELFGSADPIDQVIRIKRVPFTVIGVLETKGQSLMGTDQDDLIIVPIATARGRVLGSATQAKQRAVSTIWVKAAQGYDTKSVEEQVRALLRQRHRLQPGTEDDFSLRNLQEVMAAQEASSRVLALLLASVASVSLLVGGIGIMNIMLVSVTERTREIGLRMALGARTRDILGQFLVEAVTLSLIGGLIGVGLGLAASLAVGSFLGWQVLLSPAAVGLAVAFAFVIGVFFGFYPARKAARLNPVEALRFE